MKKDKSQKYPSVNSFDFKKNGHYLSGIAYILPPIADLSPSLNDLRNLENNGFTIQVLSRSNDLLNTEITSETLRSFNTKEFITYPRPEFKIDTAIYDNCNILITGAGGSIGSALAGRLIAYNCKNLVLLDNSEFAIYKLKENLTLRNPFLKPEFIVADVRDNQRLNFIFKSHKTFDFVFHLAANKHVNLMEDDVIEAFSVNVIGTKNVYDLSIKHNIKKFYFISTDKAVEPINSMGMSKKIAEQYILSSPSKSTISCVFRFGNILSSNGSVIESFLTKINFNQSLHVYNKTMERYFILKNDIIDFLLGSDELYENKDTLIFNVEKAIKIKDLASSLLKINGKFNHEATINIGKNQPFHEKQKELMYTDQEALTKTNNKHVLRIPKTREQKEFLIKLNEFISQRKKKSLENPITKKDLIALLND